MTFAERLKDLRAQSGLSQEKLAEKVGVSRQTITKWETNKGTPDVENLMLLSELFEISIDELLAGKRTEPAPKDYLYESVTEYDISDAKRYDIKIGGAKVVYVTAYDGEKIHVRLASNIITTLQADFKVKVDDTKGRLDVDVIRQNKMTEAASKEGLYVFIRIPEKYSSRIELAANTSVLKVAAIESEDLEFDGKVQMVRIDRFSGELELNCNLDMEIDCLSFCGSIEINQISSVSRITVSAEQPFSVVKKGIGNSIYFERNGKAAEDFSTADSEAVIELNGVRSELFICTGKEAEEK